MVIPEASLQRVLRTGLKAIRYDYGVVVDKNKSWLAKVIKLANLERYNALTQAVELFITPSNENEPKGLDFNIGFDIKRLKDPNVYIIIHSETPTGKDGLGWDQGIKTDFDEVEKTYNNYYQRDFKSKLSLLITSSNSNEVMLIYHVCRALLVAAVSDLHSEGFKNVCFQGEDVRLDQQVVDRVFMRNLHVSFEYELSVPDFHQIDYVTEITVTQELV